MKEILKLIIEKRRLVQWLLIICGTTLCCMGGAYKFLSADNIIQIFLVVIASLSAIEAAAKD